ncbi:efflux RND transporter permease subunit [Selenomonas ruminis]|uniref:Multidrug efflux RND transporter permease subunit n=1 Tax=Selenomonas ruminis TaxID=2593411 RepID=A0A5D6VZX3_9FIRM|nr:multidrug efflux RND transporter permease subunit [Selenomonas sp. mPRGC5]TYZ21127.1 multidrug efflux RND transporter permease subunit [Selenomonas sp. mPRGC5]
MSKFFIHRPIFAIVISVIIVIVGVLAAFQLPIAQYPQISPPTVSVSTTYTGANASVVNETVAQIVEQQINGTQGMDYMSSNSDDTGRYSLKVVFETGTDGDMDSVKVQNNAATATASLPSDVQTVGLTTRKSSNDMAYMLSLYSPDGSYDRAFMKNYADIYLLDELKRVPGVGDVQIFGSDYAMRVWLNPDKLAELNLTVADVTSAIKEQNVQAPAGTVGAMPVNNGQEKQYTGKISGRLVTPEEFGNVILRSDNGKFVRLKDVARVETGEKSSSIVSKFNGYPSVGFGINLTSDANAMETVAGVRKVLEKAEPNLPPNLKMSQIFDSTNYIKASIKEVLETFLEALALVVLVIFLFLQNWRATIIPLLAVPVSLIGTLAAFIVLDFSINTLTLFAMVLAIGLVVDDAIVVIENVEKHMEEGLEPVDATERAMDEVQGPVVAIAFVLAAVFVPVAFLGGMTGVLYKQFALTIAVSMALSAFVALTLTPALCAMILKRHEEKDDEGALGRFFVKFNNWFERTKRGYMGIVAKFIRRTRLAILFMVIVCIAAGAVYKIMPSTFVPSEDQGYLFTVVQLPEGTSMNQTQKSIDKVAKAAMENVDGVENVMAITGFDILSGGAKPSAGMVVLGMKDWSQRTAPGTSVDAAVGKMFGLGAKVAPEATVIAMNPPALPGLGSVGGWSLELQDMSGHTDKELSDITNKIVAAANQRPELQGVRTTFKMTAPSYEFEIDRERVKQLGVQLSDVFTAMQVNFGGTQVNDFNQFGRSYKVMLQADTQYRSEADAAKFIFVKSSSGTMVPLDTLLKPKLSSGPTSISRFNGARSVTIQGNAGQGYSSGQAMAAIQEIVKQNTDNGFNIEWSGQSREESKASSSTLQVLGLALVFVFLCLAALYESWSVPFAVLLTVPTGIMGALVSEYGLSMLEAMFGHVNAGLQNSVYMQIGIIMIIGLAAKNAILIVEFAKVRVDRGMEPVKAAIEAAGLRLRPILMTSFAFIIGCLPLAVASGAGAAARNGMGVAVVGGMLFATVLGIFLIPVFFVAMEWIAAKLGMFKQQKKKTTADYM